MRATRAWSRSAVVGILATLADLGALTVAVELVGFSATAANVPALLLGAVVQYAGNKRWAFGDRAPSSARKVAGFALVEAVTLALNALAFHALVTATAVPYALARALGTFAVWAGFSQPLWARIFRPTAASARA